MSRNTIDKHITEADKTTSKGRSVATCANLILANLEDGAPWRTDFPGDSVDPPLTAAQKTQLNELMKSRFETWANAWIAPYCRQIIVKTRK
jgi:hypothetical protein